MALMGCCCPLASRLQAKPEQTSITHGPSFDAEADNSVQLTNFREGTPMESSFHWLS